MEQKQQKMSLEDFKKEVEQTLLKQETKSYTQTLMKDYEPDFPRLLNEGWDPKTAAQAMVNYLI